MLISDLVAVDNLFHGLQLLFKSLSLLLQLLLQGPVLLFECLVLLLQDFETKIMLSLQVILQGGNICFKYKLEALDILGKVLYLVNDIR